MTNRISKLDQRTTSWIMSNADKMKKLPNPDENPWNTEEKDLTNAEINLWRAKGVIRRVERNDDGVRCDWITPEEVWDRFETSVRKYSYDESLLDDTDS